MNTSRALIIAAAALITIASAGCGLIPQPPPHEEVNVSFEGEDTSDFLTDLGPGRINAVRNGWDGVQWTELRFNWGGEDYGQPDFEFDFDVKLGHKGESATVGVYTIGELPEATSDTAILKDDFSAVSNFFTYEEKAGLAYSDEYRATSGTIEIVEITDDNTLIVKLDITYRRIQNVTEVSSGGGGIMKVDTSGAMELDPIRITLDASFPDASGFDN